MNTIENQVSQTSQTSQTSENPSEGRWLVSCACLPFTNLLATGSYDDCVRLWDINPSNRDKDGQLLKQVNTIPIV